MTLFEKTEELGGQLHHADYLPCKWSLHDLKEYLIRQVHKNGVSVKVGIEATPEMIAGKFDAVIAACGAKAKQLPDACN